MIAKVLLPSFKSRFISGSKRLSKSRIPSKKDKSALRKLCYTRPDLSFFFFSLCLCIFLLFFFFFFISNCTILTRNRRPNPCNNIILKQFNNRCKKNMKSLGLNELWKWCLVELYRPTVVSTANDFTDRKS